jgi:MYXO-CTERM domain-containing protein
MNCNGERCVLVARDSSWITARRMSATNASFIDATPIQIHQDSASPIAVAADTEPAPALRTFLIVFVQGGQVLARRFRADTGSVLPVTTLDTASALGNVAATSDSRQFYVTWIRNGRLVGTLVDAFTGLPTLAQPVDLGEGVAAGSLVFDGTSFVPVWYTNSGLRATRVSTSGALLEGESPVAQAYSPQTTAAAATRFGRTLAVFPVVEIENFSNAVHGRFLDNEAGPGLSARPAQVCSGGAGGAGGTGGVGGTGMAGAAGSAGASGGGLGGAAGFGGGTSGAGNGGAGGAGATAGGAGMTAGSTGLAGSGGAAGSAGATGGVAGGAGAPGEGGEGGEAGGPDEPDGGTSSAGTAGLGGLSGASGLGGYAATAGASSAGAASGANGTTGKVASDDDAGCGCRTPPKHRRPGLLAPVLAALFVLTRHRRRRTGRRTAA